jgi:DTW domain-containing protein YfiP
VTSLEDSPNLNDVEREFRRLLRRPNVFVLFPTKTSKNAADIFNVDNPQKDDILNVEKPQKADILNVDNVQKADVLNTDTLQNADTLNIDNLQKADNLQESYVLIVLDGTWREAKKMYFRSPALQKLPAIHLDLRSVDCKVLLKNSRQWKSNKQSQAKIYHLAKIVANDET